MSTHDTKALPEIIPINKMPPANESIMFDGIEYVSSFRLACLTGKDRENIKLYRDLGMPFVKTTYNRVFLHPVEACKAWILENAGDPRRIKEIEIDGELCYNAVYLAEVCNRPISTIRAWKRRGMPFRTYRGATFYPAKPCKEWVRQNACAPRNPKGFNGVTAKATLCTYCDNAYAGRCSWFTNYTPVPGWTADEKKHEPNASGPSYFVRKCPNFVKDKPRKHK